MSALAPLHDQTGLPMPLQFLLLRMSDSLCMRQQDLWFAFYRIHHAVVNLNGRISEAARRKRIPEAALPSRREQVPSPPRKRRAVDSESQAMGEQGKSDDSNDEEEEEELILFPPR